MLGLVVTLITQSGNNSPRDAAAQPSAPSVEPVTPETPTSETPTSETPATADPSESTADDVVTTVSPSPSPSQTSAKILRTGDFTLARGHSADLEHGTVGPSVKNPDMAWHGGDEFSAMNGRVADTQKGATPKICAKALDSPRSTGWMVAGLEGTWFCMPTSANHLAAVEWLGDGEGGLQFHYIVWGVTAPTDDT
ncbi:hypothetical protein ACLMNJ_14040 [Streptomyces seoulensis]